MRDIQSAVILVNSALGINSSYNRRWNYFCLLSIVIRRRGLAVVAVIAVAAAAINTIRVW